VSDFLGGLAPAVYQALEVVSSSWFAQACPFGVNTHHTLTREARGYAKILAGASILAIPSSFARRVTSEASLNLNSTASAKAKSPDGSEHSTATNPPAVATLLSVLPASFPVSEFAGEITSDTHQVLAVPADQWLAPECSLGPFPHHLWSRVAGGPANILVGATTLAIRPSFDSHVPSGA